MATFEELLDGKPPLNEICEHVRINKWFNLGIQLQLDDVDLEEIREDGPDKRNRMYQLWLRTQPKASRRQLLDTLRRRDVGEYTVADRYENFLQTKAAPLSSGTQVEQSDVSDTKSTTRGPAVQQIPTHDRLYLDNTINDTTILQIARVIVKWEELGTQLGLTRIEIEDIKRDYRGDYNHQKIQVLYKWKEKNGLDGTYFNMIEAVKQDNRELGEEIARISKIANPQNEPQYNGSQYLDDKICDALILKIASKIVTWDELAIYLGMTQAEKENIKRDNVGDYAQQKVQLLFKWREKYGVDATYRKLTEAMVKMGCKEQAEEIVDLVKNSKQNE